VAAFTWADLLFQIGFRLNRIDLPNAFVREMAAERVDFYGPQVLYPAEVVNNDIVTNQGQQFYPLPRGTQKVRYVRILQGGIWIPCPIADHYEDILYSDPQQPPFVSLPVSLCAVLGNQLRLFPTPFGPLPVELTIDQTIIEPTDDNDSTNFWVTDGRILLINSTCLEICSEYLDIEVPQSPRIEKFQKNTDEALAQLMGRSHALSTPSLMKQHL
jgi:hypothetical protein